VLLTTFSEALAHALEKRLKTLVAGEPDVAARIIVKAIGRVGIDLYADRFGLPNVAATAAIRAWIIEAARNRTGIKFSMQFMQNEWFEIIDPWLVGSVEDYGKVSRLGRKTRLSANQRDALWPIFREVRGALKAQGAVTNAEMFARLAESIRTGGRPYDFAVVDEAQDLGVAKARFLAALGAIGRMRCSSLVTSASASSRPRSRGKRSALKFADVPRRFGSTTELLIKFVARPIDCCPARSLMSTATR
jgi:hypothetical protein